MSAGMPFTVTLPSGAHWTPTFVQAHHGQHAARADLEAAAAADAFFFVDVLDKRRHPGFAARQRD